MFSNCRTSTPFVHQLPEVMAEMYETEAVLRLRGWIVRRATAGQIAT